MQIKLFKTITIVFILFIIGVLFAGLNKDSIYSTQELTGNKLTNIKLAHFSENRFVTNKDLKANFTLINFWASWCSPCREEHSYLLKLNEEKNLELLGVNFKDKKNNAIKFLDELGNPYDDLAKDELGKYSINFGIYGVPESILIDKEFRIIKKFIGPINEEDFYLIKKVIKDK